MSHRNHQEVEAFEPAEDEHTRSARAMIGQTLCGRWRLDALIGIGGMAAVYSATHRNGKRVAVKLLHCELSRNAELRQRFLDEGYAANRVGHPSAVSVLDDGISEEGGVFLVMDLLEGETLESRIRRTGRLAPREVLMVADSLLDVLAEAHDKQIIHRDVKPDNIFITQEGALKLFDFGIARMIKPGRPRTTQTGAPMGTPAFMPPEQARGHWEPLDGRTDIWAVGATMFSALTGRQVHEGETTNEELVLAMTQPASSLGDVAPTLPPGLVEIVDRALAFDKEDRWPSARAMQAAIRAELAIPGVARLSGVSLGSDLPAESGSPVALFTPSAVTSRAYSTLARPRSAGARAISITVTASLGLVIIAVLLGSKSRVPDGGSATPATRPPAALEIAIDRKESLLELEVLQPSELAFAEPEPAISGSPSIAKTSRASPLDEAPARGSVATPIGSANSVAPAALAPLAVDPLERRK